MRLNLRWCGKGKGHKGRGGITSAWASYLPALVQGWCGIYRKAKEKNRNGKESLRAADSEEEGEELEKSGSPGPPPPLADDPAETPPGGGAAEIDWPSPQDDRGLDSGLKAAEFEEALAEEADELESEAEAGEQGPAEGPAGNAPRRLPSFFTDGPRSPGEKFYVARGISLLSKGAGEFVKTTARVGPGGGRVGSGAAHGEVRVNHASAEAEVQYLGEGRVHLGDHALALVMVDKAPTAIVVGIDSARAPGGIAIGVSGISTGELLDSRSLVLVRPLKSAATAEGHLTFAGDGSSRAVRLSGPFLEPVCLDLKGTGDSTVHTMDIDTLREVDEAMWMRITAAPGALPALLKKCGPEVCHKSNAGLRLFLLAADADAEMLPQTEHTCSLPTCGLRLIDANHAVNHAAYHRLFTPELLTSAETCALCLGPSSACPPFLFKTTTLQPRLFCVVFSPGANMGDASSAVKFTGAGMKNSTTNMPSTNMPIVCPLCEPALAEKVHMSPQSTGERSLKKLPAMRPAVMKYNMKAHWAAKHGSTVMPAGLSKSLELAPNEKALLGANRGGKVSATLLATLSLA